MVSVKGGNIYHIRGDTGVLLFQPTDETGKDVADFTATLSVKKDINADDYLLQKTCANGKFNFRPEDTDGLAAGTYVYDIEVHTGDDVQTIGPYKYYLMPDVTRPVRG